jgi:anti-sigma regulatory factor (Ser/Thr protein kinase)
MEKSVPNRSTPRGIVEKPRLDVGFVGPLVGVPGKAGRRRGAPFRLKLPALPENVALIRAAVGERAEAYGFGSSVIADLKTVVSEASANVILHAYADAADPGPLEVEMTRDATRVIVVVRDRGLGIRPRPKTTPATLKMGLSLIGAISSSFHLRSARDLGTELRMNLALPAHG